MPNLYYVHGTYPITNSSGASAGMRAELDAVMAGFALLPPPLGSGQQGFNAGSWNNPQVVAGTIDGTVIGGVTPAAGSFTILAAQSFSATALDGTPIGGVTPAAGAFTTLRAAALSAAALDSTPIGGVTPAAGAFTTLRAAALSAAALDSTPIGGVTPAAGAFTTLKATSLDSTPIGGVTPAAGAFTTLLATGAVSLQAGGSIAGSYTGAPVMSGTWTLNGGAKFSDGSTALTACTGDVVLTAASTPNPGFLKANGAALSRTAYATLYARIGTTYGVGDGSTTFNLPDMRGIFARGWVDNGSIDVGRVLGSVQADGFASHTHGLTDPTHAHVVYDPTHAHSVADPMHAHPIRDQNGNNASVRTLNGGNGISDVTGNSNTVALSSGTQASATGIGIYGAATGIGIYASATGISIQANGGTETRPRNMALLACIKY